VVAALGVAYTAWQDPNAGGVFPQCPTRELFGVDCPGCGGLRAVHALTQGHLAAAADHNLLAMVVLPLVLVAWGAWMLRSTSVVSFRLPRPPAMTYATVALVLVAFTIVRNLGGVGFFEYLHSSA